MRANSKTLDRIIYKRLQKLFTITFICLSVCYFAGSIYVYLQLKKVENNLTYLDLSNKHPMLSHMERPTESSTARPESPEKQAIANLDSAIINWKASLASLTHDIQQLKTEKEQPLTTLNQSFENYFKASKITLDQIAALHYHPDIEAQIIEVYKIENRYLNQTEILTSYYSDRIDQISSSFQTQLILSCILGLLLIAIAYWLVLRPMAKYISRVIKELLDLEKNAQEKARSADILNQEKQQSVNQLKTLNSVMEQSLLFARVDPQGYIINAGSKFSRFFNYTPGDTEIQFSELIAKDQKNREYINNILNTHKNTGWQGEIKGSTPQGEPCWFEISINPYHTENNNEALLVICFDITQRKKAQNQISQLNKEHFESQMDRQKELSSKIIENQEKEQNRIAKDIHDGIGQMLTGLKFTIESIQTDNIDNTNEKIEQLKSLTSEIIRGVRTATFNLSPPELADYGIAASLSKLGRELTKFTGIEIITVNKTEFNLRLEPLVEINLYRIVQEAVNNAIKYAEASQIIISISHSEDMLSIIIDDNGKGFDPDNVKPQEEQGGMGLTFMKERIAYISGRLFISSSEKVGTRVTLNIPM